MKSLINLGGSFAAQGGYENHLGVSVQDALHAFIHSMRHHVAAHANRNDAHTKSAVDLLELIDDQAT